MCSLNPEPAYRICSPLTAALLQAAREIATSAEGSLT
jgi:hypothetical protein